MFPLVSLASFDTNLKYGAKGDTVKELQEFLTDQGVYSGPITGNYYALTLKGVKDFQIKANIFPASGYFGPLSRTKANELFNAKLGVSNADEIAQTGSVSTPVVSDMQKQIDALLLQLQTLNSRLQAQTSQTSSTPVTYTPPQNPTAQTTPKMLTIKVIQNPSSNPVDPNTVSVAYGANQTFNINPHAITGFGLVDVLVDGISQGPIRTYTFKNVTTDHTLTAVTGPFSVTAVAVNSVTEVPKNAESKIASFSFKVTNGKIKVSELTLQANTRDGIAHIKQLRLKASDGTDMIKQVAWTGEITFVGESGATPELRELSPMSDNYTIDVYATLDDSIPTGSDVSLKMISWRAFTDTFELVSGNYFGATNPVLVI